MVEDAATILVLVDLDLAAGEPFVEDVARRLVGWQICRSDVRVHCVIAQMATKRTMTTNTIMKRIPIQSVPLM